MLPFHSTDSSGVQAGPSLINITAFWKCSVAPTGLLFFIEIAWPGEHIGGGNRRRVHSLRGKPLVLSDGLTAVGQQIPLATRMYVTEGNEVTGWVNTATLACGCQQ